MINFWEKLHKPIFALAPMEEVTDTVFRQIVMQCGRPSVMFTEFVNCEGLQSVGQAKVIHRLKYAKNEKPLVAQVWGITPQNYYDSAKLVAQLGFDGLDLNFGCPVKKVIKAGACSALIKNPTLALEIILATREGLNNKIPLSIKTRIGFDKVETEKWIGFLLEKAKPEALTIHGRTVKELSQAPVHWDQVALAVQLKNSLSPETKILGNGDIFSYAEGLAKIQEYGLDGVMIGRGIFQNPWFFNPQINLETKTSTDKLALLEKHVRLFEQTWNREKDFHILKRFFKIYLHGFNGASQLREKFMQANNYDDVYDILKSL